MADFRTLAIKLISANGKIDPHQIKLLKKSLVVDGKLPEEDLTFLTDLRTALAKKTKKVPAKFDAFYMKCLQITCLSNGAVGTQELEVIGKRLIEDETIKPSVKKKFLDTIKKKAGVLAPEFDDLYAKVKK